jgi:hypothetical protein
MNPKSGGKMATALRGIVGECRAVEESQEVSAAITRDGVIGDGPGTHRAARSDRYWCNA